MIRKTMESIFSESFTIAEKIKVLFKE